MTSSVFFKFKKQHRFGVPTIPGIVCGAPILVQKTWGVVKISEPHLFFLATSYTY